MLWFLLQAQQLLHAGMHTLPSRRLAALPQDAAHEEDTLEALVLQNIKVQLVCLLAG
jgi:hypothetical protein